MSRPDEKLIELGKSFDRQLAITLPLQEEQQRLHQIYERALADAGLPDSASAFVSKEGRRLAKITGWRDATDKANRAHNELLVLMKKIYREKPTTLAGLAVFVTAVTFDQFDFETDFLLPGFARRQGADVAEKQLIRLAKFARAAAGGTQ
ncbi:MAG: hypothetical protein JNK47_12895 [Mesorhizobium sp.]|nr:hypothetical protein [Mesorhizobium sp.]MBL8578117.1 hypothetical protein [Mesorhizobium sp.]